MVHLTFYVDSSRMPSNSFQISTSLESSFKLQKFVTGNGTVKIHKSSKFIKRFSNSKVTFIDQKCGQKIFEHLSEKTFVLFFWFVYFISKTENTYCTTRLIFGTLNPTKVQNMNNQGKHTVLMNFCCFS